MALCKIDDETDRSDIILQDQVADVIMLFLPGVVSGLQEIAIGNEVQGHKLTMVIKNNFYNLQIKNMRVDFVYHSL